MPFVLHCGGVIVAGCSAVDGKMWYHGIVWCTMITYDMVQYGWHGMTMFGRVWYGIYSMVWHGKVR